MNATEELVAIPPTPAADLVGQIMERVAIPAAVEKLASAGYAIHTREQIQDALAAGVLVVEKLAAVSAGSGQFDFRGHLAKTAAALGEVSPDQVAQQNATQALMQAIVADEELNKAAAAAFVQSKAA